MSVGEIYQSYGYIEDSYLPAMFYSLESGPTLGYPGGYGPGDHFNTQAWIKDEDTWRSQSDGSTSVFPNYSTSYASDLNSCTLDSAVSPNPSVARPETAKNRFTWFLVAISVPNDAEVREYVDHYTAHDDAGTHPPNLNGTWDADGSVMSIAVWVHGTPPAGGGGGG